MSGEQNVKEIARAAVVLCADLLRRYGEASTGQAYVRTGYETRGQVDEWGRQVLAWQDQLDQIGDGP